MTSPKVTVLITVYNAEKYVRQAIESILDQTFTGFEMLIVDDGSTDRSYAIAQSYRDSRLRVIREPMNRGCGFCRAEALTQARGEYVAVLDADDVALRQRLQVQVDYLDLNPDVVMVGSAYQVIDEGGRIKSVCNVTNDSTTIRWRMLFGNCVANSTTMFRRQLALDAGGYDPRLPRGDDFDLWTRLIPHGRIVLLDRVLSQYRQHCESLTYRRTENARRIAAQTVVNSIRLQTNLIVGTEVGAVLYRHFPVASKNRAAVFKAYDTIRKTLEYFRTSLQMNETQAKHLTYLALEDIFRIARNNPTSSLRALRTALECANVHKPQVVFTMRLAGTALRALVLGIAAKIVKRALFLEPRSEISSKENAN